MYERSAILGSTWITRLTKRLGTCGEGGIEFAVEMMTSGVTKFEGRNANEPGLQHLFIPNQMWGKDETSGRGLDSKVGWTLYWRKEWFSHSGKKEIAFLPAYGPMATYFSRGCKKVATCIPFLVPGQEWIFGLCRGDREME